MAFAGGLRLEQHLCTGLQGTFLCPRFQSDTLTAENEIKSFLTSLPGQVQSSSLMIYVGLVLLPGLPAVKRPNGCRRNGAGAMEERAHFRAKRGENNQRPFPIDSAKVKPATIDYVEPATYVLFDGKQVRKSNEAPKDRQSVSNSD